MAAEIRESARSADTSAPDSLPDAQRTSQRLTERQVEAVYAVMRLLRDDSPSPSAPEVIVCDRCRRQRPGQGSVTYGSILLCNGCATDFELLRAARSVRRIEDFLGTASQSQHPLS